MVMVNVDGRCHRRRVLGRQNVEAATPPERRRGNLAHHIECTVHHFWRDDCRQRIAVEKKPAQEFATLLLELKPLAISITTPLVARHSMAR
jgi:hypothetical protein